MIAGGLNNEHVLAANRLINGDGAFAIRELGNCRVAKTSVKLRTNAFRKGAVGVAGEYLDFLAV